MYVKTLARKGGHNDIGLRNRDLAFAEGKAAYAAVLEAAVLTVKGELIYNVNQGIPYFDTAFNSPIYLKVWASAVQDRIRAFDFVNDIESFEYEWNTETQTVNYKARITTDSGVVEIAGRNKDDDADNGQRNVSLSSPLRASRISQDETVAKQEQRTVTDCAFTLARKGEHNDIGLRNRDLAFAEGKAAYAAVLEAAVLTVKGELIYNVNQGIPYFDTAFNSPIYLKVWASAVQDRIRAFDFVNDIESFEYEWNTETQTVSYKTKVKTVDGVVEIPSVKTDPEKPYDYRVEWIRSDNESCVMSGYVPTSDFMFDFKAIVKPNLGSWNSTIVSTEWVASAASSYYTISHPYNTEKIRSIVFSPNTAAEFDMPSDHLVVGNVNRSTTTFNGVSKNNEDVRGSSGTSQAQIGLNCTLYYCKIYSGSNLVRCYLPCVKNGIGCLYDTVSRTVSNYTGAVTPGPMM